jgi:hypothetical protein
MTATVLLVHGAIADGSSWNNVIARLRKEGITARVVANPLRAAVAELPGQRPAGVHHRHRAVPATITELDGGSHSISGSRPDDVAASIADAVRASS